MSVRFGRSRVFGVLPALALVVGLSGCVGLPGVTGDSARLHQEAQADLTRWADAVGAAGGSSSFVPVGELTAQVGDWELEVGNNNKPALMAGLVEAAIALPTDTPPDGQVQWPDGSTANVTLISAQQALVDLKAAAGAGSCPECTPLQITGARLTYASIQTSRGPAQAPVWEFTLKGTSVLVTRVAIANHVAVAAPTWDPYNSPVGISIYSATGSVGGQTLTVTFEGAPDTGDKPCGADYTAEAVESPTAVVVIVIEHPHQSLFGESCAAVGAFRTAEVKLVAPLGDRAVLEVKEGLPVTVTLSR